ncbi:hypothetical protein VN97_g6997 [Penicillium thymicola]|uniref:Uncharacterized protein n=1 Tax=Penicillium thymicola TaxID=293382 RepID=A0AAI9X744_PENTH|nr:hypothetical protein VN97_g6997 [Penicillium thymicola]
MTTFANYPDLKDKVALVMGIGQVHVPDSRALGNGAAIARVLAHSGARIFGCDLNLAAAQRTAALIKEEGGSCEVMHGDVTSATDIKDVVDTAMTTYGRIDILINNVGTTATGDPVSMSEDVWDRQISLNLKSVYLSCHAVLPVMEKQGSGSVINNASIAGLTYIGKPQVAYSSAKAAVIHFTKVTVAMCAAKGIRLNSVVPGLIHTPLVEKLKLDGDHGVYQKICQQPIPMGYMGDSIDVANATVFLASDVAKYITGQMLVVDGGFTSCSGIL